MKFIDPYGLKQKLGIKTSDFTDPRDNQKYKTIIIDGTEWFAENLNYNVTEDYGGNLFVDLFYDSLPVFSHPKSFPCGLFYTFDSAKMACPAGWEIPKRDVFISLFKKITNLDPNEWKAAEKTKIYHSIKSILLPQDNCGSWNKSYGKSGFNFGASEVEDTLLTSTPGSMSNGGSIFTFKKRKTTFEEAVGYGYYSVRPIRKNI